MSTNGVSERLPGLRSTVGFVPDGSAFLTTISYEEDAYLKLETPMNCQASGC